MPLDSIRGDLILVDDRMGSDMFIVKVDGGFGRTKVAVDRDCNYVVRRRPSPVHNPRNYVGGGYTDLTW
jgi:hypothetical protein